MSTISLAATRRLSQLPVVRTIEVPAGPGWLGVGLGYVWIADTKERSLRQIDPSTNTVVRTIAVNISQEPEGSIGVGAGSIWLLTDDNGTDSADESVQRINVRTNRVVADIPVHPSPRFLATGENGIWVLSQGDGALVRIDPVANRVSATIAVGFPEPGGDLWVDDCIVWASAEGAPLSMIDPNSNALVKP